MADAPPPFFQAVQPYTRPPPQAMSVWGDSGNPYDGRMATFEHRQMQRVQKSRVAHPLDTRARVSFVINFTGNADISIDPAVAGTFLDSWFRVRGTTVTCSPPDALVIDTERVSAPIVAVVALPRSELPEERVSQPDFRAVPGASVYLEQLAPGPDLAELDVPSLEFALVLKAENMKLGETVKNSVELYGADVFVRAATTFAILGSNDVVSVLVEITPDLNEGAVDKTNVSTLFVFPPVATALMGGDPDDTTPSQNSIASGVLHAYGWSHPEERFRIGPADLNSLRVTDPFPRTKVVSEQEEASRAWLLERDRIDGINSGSVLDDVAPIALRVLLQASAGGDMRGSRLGPPLARSFLGSPTLRRLLNVIVTTEGTLPTLSDTNRLPIAIGFRFHNISAANTPEDVLIPLLSADAYSYIPTAEELESREWVHMEEAPWDYDAPLPGTRNIGAVPLEQAEYGILIVLLSPSLGLRVTRDSTTTALLSDAHVLGEGLTNKFDEAELSVMLSGSWRPRRMSSERGVWAPIPDAHISVVYGAAEAALESLFPIPRML